MSPPLKHRAPTDFSDAQLNAQQRSLRHQARIHWAHWCILGLSVIFTFLGWRFSDSLLQANEQNRFEREAYRVVDQMRVRMAHYEDALLAGVATLHSHQGDMTRTQWRDYASSLKLTARYPGVNGIGLIREIQPGKLGSFEESQQLDSPGFHVFPEHDHPTLLPIVYIEPENTNAAAIGLDVAFEENRRTAALRAKDLDTTQITGPIELVQDNSKTPGFLFYAPVYLDNSGFEGLIYAPLVVKNLVYGVRGAQTHQVYFSIRDGDSILYDESALHSADPDTVTHTMEITREFYGRTWHFLIQSTPAFTAASGMTLSTVVLICGLIIEAMLLALFLMLTRSNHRILNLAEAMTERLAQQTKVLANKNSELESFAHIVSHDLKTPIRGIQTLALFIEEDMEDLQAPQELKSVIKKHIHRIDEQAERGQALIGGLLKYSLIGYETDSLEVIDTRSMLRDISNSLNLKNDQLQIGSDMPILRSYSVQLTQVFENLIGNAHKYHPSPDSAKISVTVERRQEFFRFSVADDGNGIDAQYRERIFKPFTMLQPHATLDSSGIGLSIVKKTVEGLGGSVGIQPNKPNGAVFFFDWPIAHKPSNEALRHAA